ncbi:MAG: hypothetical protein Q9187_000984 [Circinaria calcarea]
MSRKTQIYELFIPNLKSATETSTSSLTPREKIFPELDLEKVAVQFASLLPDDKFTPAEIQGFLLTRKKEPNKALEEVVGWRDKLLNSKAAKSNLIRT